VASSLAIYCDVASVPLRPGDAPVPHRYILHPSSVTVRATLRDLPTATAPKLFLECNLAMLHVAVTHEQVSQRSMS
jgi:hypothetical protein